VRERSEQRLALITKRYAARQGDTRAGDRRAFDD
jgi:hypothetical protein